MALRQLFSVSPQSLPLQPSLGSIARGFAKVVFKDGEKQVDLAKAAQANSDISLLDALKEAGVPIQGNCGGFGVCGTCQVVLDEESFKAAGQAEDDELDVLDGTSGNVHGARLACQVKASALGKVGEARIAVP